jgi:hypothetical protein
VPAYRGDERQPYTVYDYTPRRARDGPAAFLEDYSGYLQAAAFGGYNGIYANGRVIEVLCWAHCRRRFCEAQESDAARALLALAYIRKLYQVERQAQEEFQRQPSSPAARSLAVLRLKLRQQSSKEVLKNLETWMRRQMAGYADDGSSPLPGGPVLPKSPLGTAINYCLKNWPALERYADDGDLDIDNNASERDLRPIAVGRSNWTFFGSDNGGRTAAVLYSLVATAKRHGLDPFVYLRDVLGRLSDHPMSRLEELLPDHWKLASAVPTPQPA